MLNIKVADSEVELPPSTRKPRSKTSTVKERVEEVTQVEPVNRLISDIQPVEDFLNQAISDLKYGDEVVHGTVAEIKQIAMVMEGYVQYTVQPWEVAEWLAVAHLVRARRTNNSTVLGHASVLFKIAQQLKSPGP